MSGEQGLRPIGEALADVIERMAMPGPSDMDLSFAGFHLGHMLVPSHYDLAGRGTRIYAHLWHEVFRMTRGDPHG